jgi:hypothetical protein
LTAEPDASTARASSREQDVTREASLSILLDRLAGLAGAEPPATTKAIEAVERRLGIRLSAEFREAYLRLNGTVDGTPVENGWFELWALERWYSVEQYVRDLPDWSRSEFADISRAIVFADYSIESWHYAALFSFEASTATTPIYLLHARPSLAANSLNEFLAAALVDGPEIYPPV